ncbi:MAG: hypothetical protein LBO71_10900 [Prevotellaceae bacterium]|jgi:hypothetical protein|nr:hypothetical protein [Prevotellaceae bacterium]
MKTISCYILALAALALWACEPITNIIDEAPGGNISSAGELQATVAIVQKDGYSNIAHVHCSSPVLCSWTDGINTFVGTEGNLEVVFAGDQTITLTARTADGKEYTKDFPVTVASAPEPPAYYGLLFGDPNGDGKTWEWSTKVAPGREAAGEKMIMAGSAPSGENRDYWGWCPEPTYVPNEGVGAKMKFTLRGKRVTKIGVDGKETGSGSLDLNMTPNSIAYSVGTITFKGTNVLCPVSGNGELGSTWTICHLSEDLLLLFNANSSSGWYYVFTAAE